MSVSFVDTVIILQKKKKKNTECSLYKVSGFVFFNFKSWSKDTYFLDANFQSDRFNLKSLPTFCWYQIAARENLVLLSRCKFPD